MKNAETIVDALDPRLLQQASFAVRIRRLVVPFYRLTKPGIVYSNVMTALAGYLFASQWHVQAPVFAGLLGGTALIIAASCVANNVIDRNIDAKMRRTMRRATVTGAISRNVAMIYSLTLGCLGFLLLAQTNALTMIVGVGAVLGYVVLYGIAKRRSVHGTLVGTLPGAASLIAGYTAVTNRLDVVVLILFLAMVVWQMAHFYAIAIFRHDDYAAAGVPVRSVVKGIANTRQHILAYIVLFLPIPALLTFVSRAGYFYLVSMVIIGLLWLRIALQAPGDDASAVWARKVFGCSLIALLVFSAVLSVGPLLP